MQRHYGVLVTAVCCCLVLTGFAGAAEAAVTHGDLMLSSEANPSRDYCITEVSASISSGRTDRHHDHLKRQARQFYGCVPRVPRRYVLALPTPSPAGWPSAPLMSCAILHA
jgi:hypothetical protein